jgi:hypothetical protein
VVPMMTKQELMNRLQSDNLSMQFLRFMFDGAAPSEIPTQHDENSAALLLLHAVSNGDRKRAEEVLEPISKRSLGGTPVWVNNDLFFVSLAIAALQFSLYRDFVRSAADIRDRISAGGSHRGLAQAVKAAMIGKPDFTESSAIFSLVLTRYMEDFTISNRDLLNAYDSFQSYDWTLDRHSTVSYCLALCGIHDIFKAFDLVSQRGDIAKLVAFAKKFPKRITLFSRIISWTITIIMMILFIIDLRNSNKTGIEWIMMHAFFTSGLGVSSLVAILSFVPKAQEKFTKAALWLFSYPKSIAHTGHY